MNRALLDTDTLSYFLKGNPAVVARAAEYLTLYQRLEFSTITYYEIVRGLIHSGATRKLAKFEELCRSSALWPLESMAARHAAEICAALWHAGEPLDEADILIAGTARAHDLTLISNNQRHFARVSGLDLSNWSEGAG
ncbi:MAG TPA: type II toxin-antitoxin system VapC family toxin [Armatimonadota bacterium]|nr:type II toxin-antitoxin system VapC family toxin [Armatimonadota bacterium]